jgi:hypothetical protein
MFCDRGVSKWQGCRGADKSEEVNNVPGGAFRVENGFRLTYLSTSDPLDENTLSPPSLPPMPSLLVSSLVLLANRIAQREFSLESLRTQCMILDERPLIPPYKPQDQNF